MAIKFEINESGYIICSLCNADNSFRYEYNGYHVCYYCHLCLIEPINKKTEEIVSYVNYTFKGYQIEVKGIKYTEKQFKRLLKLKAFL